MQQDLVIRARSGDHDAFSTLAARAVDRLHRTAWLILRSEADAADAVQESLLAAWLHIAAVRDPDRFDAWLNRLLVHACYRLAKRTGSRILVHDQGRYRIQVMNADGSDLRVLLEGEDACCSTAWSPAGDRILYELSVVRPGEPPEGLFDSQVWTVSPDGSNAIGVFDSAGCDMGDMGLVGDLLPVWAPGGTQVAYNDCGVWVIANADGTAERRVLGGARSGSGGPPLLPRSWDGGGLSQWDLALIGQVDH